MSTTASAIIPQDFCKYIGLTYRDRWSHQAMQCVVDALDGKKVMAITTDTRTGHTLTDVRLLQVGQTPGYGTFRVLVEYEYEPEKFMRTWYPLLSVGTIISHSETSWKGPKWAAVDLYRERGHSMRDSQESSERQALARRLKEERKRNGITV